MRRYYYRTYYLTRYNRVSPPNAKLCKTTRRLAVTDVVVVVVLYSIGKQHNRWLGQLCVPLLLSRHYVRPAVGVCVSSPRSKTIDDLFRRRFTPLTLTLFTVLWKSKLIIRMTRRRGRDRISIGWPANRRSREQTYETRTRTGGAPGESKSRVSRGRGRVLNIWAYEGDNRILPNSTGNFFWQSLRVWIVF